MSHNITVERESGKIIAECSCGQTKVSTDPKVVGEWATKHQADSK